MDKINENRCRESVKSVFRLAWSSRLRKKQLRTGQYLLALALLFSCFVANAQDQLDSNKVDKDFKGKWTIDLRPTPDSEAYYQVFSIESISENTFTGTFYGSPIEDGLLNKNWDKLYFAFSTSDQTNEYYHSGYIDQGKVFGITYCYDRYFTAPWSGTRE